MDLIKVKPNEMREIREELVKKQKGLCPICKKDIASELKTNPKGVHLDHQHFGNGRIRAALCRRCNQCEGKLWNVYLRSTKKEERSEEDYLNMINGLKSYYKRKPTNYIHPKAWYKPKKRKK